MAGEAPVSLWPAASTPTSNKPLLLTKKKSGSIMFLFIFVLREPAVFVTVKLFSHLFLGDRDAWNSLRDMPKEEAMAAYVDEMKLVFSFLFFLCFLSSTFFLSSWFYEKVFKVPWLWLADPGGHARDRRGGGAPARARTFLRAGRREEEDHADIRPERG